MQTRLAATLTALTMSVLTITPLGCGDGPPGAETSESVEFGLPGKSDQACDARAPMCWSAQEAAAMRAWFAADDALRLGLGDPRVVSAQLVAAMDQLAHKLDSGELDALDALASEPLRDDATSADRAAFADRALAEVVQRLAGGYLAAHAVVIGQAAERGTVAKSDGLGATVVEHVSVVLAELELEGPFATYVSVMLHSTGALEPLPVPIDEAFPFSEPLESRARRLADRYVAGSAAHATVANGLTFIPVAGVALSIPYGLTAQFRLRARMVLEIAAIYGVDPRSRDGLALTVAVLAAATEVPEAAPDVAIAVAAHHASRDHHGSGRGLDVHAETMLKTAMGRVGLVGARTLARIHIRAATRAGRSAVLGYATVGLATIGEIALEAGLTAVVGWRARVLARPWAQEALQSGSGYLEDRGVARCVAEVLGYVAGPEAAAPELRFLAGHLDRLIFVEGAWWQALGSDGRAGLAAGAAAAARDDAPPSCVTRALGRLGDGEALEVFSWARAIARSDATLDHGEVERLEQVAEGIRGGWLSRGGAHPARVVAHQIDASYSADGAEPDNIVRGLGETRTATMALVEDAWGDPVR